MGEPSKQEYSPDELLELAKRLKKFTVPELCDGAGNFRSMDWEIKPWIGEKKMIAGPAFPVDVPAGEGGLIADAIPQLSEGEVMVVAGKGCCKSSYWGDMRSMAAAMTKAAGVVIDGAFRDIDGCEAVGFPVFAKGLTCGTAAKNGDGCIGVPVVCGGVTVNPGDLIAADRNGVIVIRPEEAESVMERALDKHRRQQWVVEEMRRTGKPIAKVPKRIPET